jgi:Ca-activated chloride channel homolog
MLNSQKIKTTGLALSAALLSVLSACATDDPGHYSSQLSPVVATAVGENYSPLHENQLLKVNDEPVSTFSIDVDTAAYSNVRRFINNGYLPPQDAVRIEEMINYFDYDYPAAESVDEPFRIISEVAPTPWNSGSYLLHIGIKGYQPPQAEQPARNLVFLLDVSGSMDAPNKLELLKKSLRLLVNQLSIRDRVAIVVYAGASGIVLPSTPGNQRREINLALENLSAGGSTNGGAGIELAYSIAQQNYLKGGVNRVILATDGDFNVGPSSTQELKQLIKQKKHSGVALTVLGLGMGNYNDQLLEEISNVGDGNAAYIDTLQEAQKVLVQDLGGTLQTIARDAKIQLEFNPEKVSSYRLIGYENRMLQTEDFNNDRVDAGDVGAGHTVTALYEITLKDGLRYQTAQIAQHKFTDELAYLKLRYKKMGESNSHEIVHALSVHDIQTKVSETSDNFRFSAAVAAFGQLLRNSEQVGDFSLTEVETLALQSRGIDRFGYRSEFVKLVRLSASIQPYR